MESPSVLALHPRTHRLFLYCSNTLDQARDPVITISDLIPFPDDEGGVPWDAFLLIITQQFRILGLLTL
jgi:hypothetical protein